MRRKERIKQPNRDLKNNIATASEKIKYEENTKRLQLAQGGPRSSVAGSSCFEIKRDPLLGRIAFHETKSLRSTADLQV